MRTEFIELNTFAGYGSTDTKIIKFLNMIKSENNIFFQENHSSGYSAGAKGLEIMIKQNCLIKIVLLTHNFIIGISKNSTELITNINKIYNKNKLCSNGYYNYELNFNDILRVHSNGIYNYFDIYLRIDFSSLKG